MAGWTGHTPRSVGIGEALPRPPQAQDLKWSNPAGASHTAPSTKT